MPVIITFHSWGGSYPEQIDDASKQRLVKKHLFFRKRQSKNWQKKQEKHTKRTKIQSLSCCWRYHFLNVQEQPKLSKAIWTTNSGGGIIEVKKNICNSMSLIFQTPRYCECNHLEAKTIENPTIPPAGKQFSWVGGGGCVGGSPRTIVNMGLQVPSHSLLG